MNRIALAFTTALLAIGGVAGCARPALRDPEPTTPAPARGKPGAPVSIDARLAAGAARVTVRFDADARDVRIDVHGAAGLAVTSGATPVAHASFARGEATSFDVAFTPGAGRSYLAVGVAGKFHGGGKRAAVASFAVGDPTPEQLEAGGTVVEGADGERLKVVVPGR
jgi:hypothetical protein